LVSEVSLYCDARSRKHQNISTKVQYQSILIIDFWLESEI